MDGLTRRKRIVELTREHSELEVSELAAELGATQATVRRDLRLLEQEGVIRRSYGMVSAVDRSRFETPLTRRATDTSAEGALVARAAVSLLSNETSVYIDDGAIMRLLAEALPAHPALTVVTPSIPVAAALADTPHEVLLLGGRVRGRTLDSVGHWAREMLAGFIIDVAFLGANGVTIDAGLTTPDPAVAALKGVAVRVARRRIFVGDYLQFGVTSFARFAGVHDIELFVTSSRLPLSQAKRFTEVGAKIMRAR